MHLDELIQIACSAVLKLKISSNGIKTSKPETDCFVTFVHRTLDMFDSFSCTLFDVNTDTDNICQCSGVLAPKCSTGNVSDIQQTG